MTCDTGFSDVSPVTQAIVGTTTTEMIEIDQNLTQEECIIDCGQGAFGKVRNCELICENQPLASTTKAPTTTTTEATTTTSTPVIPDTTPEQTTEAIDLLAGHCSNICEECPEMEWKGGKFSKVLYEATNAFAVRINIPNNVAEHDIRADEDYGGFMIFSRRWCGADFIDGLVDGKVG